VRLKIANALNIFAIFFVLFLLGHYYNNVNFEV